MDLKNDRRSEHVSLELVKSGPAGHGQKCTFREFPGGPVVRMWAFTAMGPGLIPGWGTKIPQAMHHSQKKKKEKKEMPSILGKKYFKD